MRFNILFMNQGAICIIYLFDCNGFSLLNGLFSSFGEWGLLQLVDGPLTAAASLLAGLSLQCPASAAVARRLQGTGSIFVAHGLSCPVARGIFLNQGSNLCLLYWQADSLPCSHKGSPPFVFLMFIYLCLLDQLVKNLP